MMKKSIHFEEVLKWFTQKMETGVYFSKSFSAIFQPSGVTASDFAFPLGSWSNPFW